MASSRHTDTARPPVPALPPDLGSWIATFVAVVVSYLLLSSGFARTMSGIQVPLFVGLLAGLIAVTWLQALTVAVPALAVLLAVSPPVGQSGPVWWAIGLVIAGLASAGVAALRARHGSPRSLELAVAVLLLALVLINLWAPFDASGRDAGYGVLTAEMVRADPAPGTYVNDDQLYRHLFYLIHEGVPYYRAFQGAWEGLSSHSRLPQSVTSYREPTMYWLWRLLPDDAFTLVPLFFGFVSLGCVAAAAITALLVGARFAPLSALALAVYAQGSGATVYVTYIDLPTACVALVGVALFVASRKRGSRGLLWSSAAVLLLAALTREILAYLMVLAALSALFARREDRLAQIAPWLAGLVMFAVGYAAHAWAVVTYIAPRDGVIRYDKGSPRFVLDSVTRFSDYMKSGGVLLPVLFLLGIAGAWAAYRVGGRVIAVFLVSALVGPLVVMLKVGNPGIQADGAQVNYWGNLFVPLALSLWPAACVWLEPRPPVEPSGLDEATPLGPGASTAEIPATH